MFLFCNRTLWVSLVRIFGSYFVLFGLFNAFLLHSSVCGLGIIWASCWLVLVMRSDMTQKRWMVEGRGPTLGRLGQGDKGAH